MKEDKQNAYPLSSLYGFPFFMQFSYPPGSYFLFLLLDHSLNCDCLILHMLVHRLCHLRFVLTD